MVRVANRRVVGIGASVDDGNNAGTGDIERGDRERLRLRSNIPGSGSEMVI